MQLADAAIANGITIAAATPHHNNHRYQNPASKIADKVEQLNQELAACGKPLKIVVGQELRVNERFWDEIAAGNMITLNHSDYLLIELPTREIPRTLESIVHELLLTGITPIIAHPERNMQIAENPDRLLPFVEMGVLAQMTSHSLCGVFGRKLQKLSLEMCRRNLVHIIASDAHHVGFRSFLMKEAYAIVTREIGASSTEYYQHNAAAILHNEPITIKKAVTKSKKRFFWW